MMIKTSKLSKCLKIFLVYNINMIIYTVSCDGTDTLDTVNKFVPDYDVIQTSSEKVDYFEYYFKSSKHAGQLKVRPKTFFESVHNCRYIILPELDDHYNFNEYHNLRLNNISDPNFKLVYDTYKLDYEKLKNLEDDFVKQNEISYMATKKAYDAVINYENSSVDEQAKNKKYKEDAIKYYLNNPMPELPKDIISNAYCNKGEFRYTYKNYEIYTDPTEEVYYCSNIMKAEFNTVNIPHLKKVYNTWEPKESNDVIRYCINVVQSEYNDFVEANINKSCDNFLTTTNYYDVFFLYSFLHITVFDQLQFVIAKTYILFHLQATFSDIKKTYTMENLRNLEEIKLKTLDDHNSTIKKLQSEFVVNNENYMSYLVRMKILGNIGFHQDYHKHLYRTRSDYVNTNFDIDMDIHTEPSNAIELVPFNPEDI